MPAGVPALTPITWQLACHASSAANGRAPCAGCMTSDDP